MDSNDVQYTAGSDTGDEDAMDSQDDSDGGEQMLPARVRKFIINMYAARGQQVWRTQRTMRELC